jgi:hypothetical protein
VRNNVRPTARTGKWLLPGSESLAQPEIPEREITAFGIEKRPKLGWDCFDLDQGVAVARAATNFGVGRVR